MSGSLHARQGRGVLHHPPESGQDILHALQQRTGRGAGCREPREPAGLQDLIPLGTGVAEGLGGRHHHELCAVRLRRGEDAEEGTPHHALCEEADIPTLSPAGRGDEAGAGRCSGGCGQDLPDTALGRLGQVQLADVAGLQADQDLPGVDGCREGKVAGCTAVQLRHRGDRPPPVRQADNRQHQGLRTERQDSGTCRLVKGPEGCHRAEQAHHHHDDTEVSLHL